MERAPEVPVGGVEQPHATTVGPRADTPTTDTPTGPAPVAERSPTTRLVAVDHRPSGRAAVGGGSYRDRMERPDRPDRPHVVVYNEASIDGRVVGFDTDPSRYYRLGFRWRSDAILMGSTTALAFGPPEPEADQRRIVSRPARLPVVPGFESLVTEPRPLLVVPDSGGVVRCWIHARAQPWYRDVVVLVTRHTPSGYLRYLDHRGIEHVEATDPAGRRVDLAAALAHLAGSHGVRDVRTDGGGALTGALLAAGLVDEIVVLLDPVASSDPDGQRLVALPRPGPPGGIPLRLDDVERFEDGALLLRYATT